MSHQAAEVNQSPEAKKSLFDAVGGFFDSAKKGLGSAIDGVANAVPNLPHLQGPLSDEELHKIDRYFRASNFLTIGQIYLRENPLLKEPLKPEHIKPRLLGHWGTSPGLSLLYIHMNRLIKQKNLDAIFLCGPGHGGPAIVAQTYLEGTYTEIYPEITTDVVGLRKLFRQFSQPGGIPSHVSPNVPGSIHEGGELGYVLSHAFGAVMDSPNLIVLAVVGDGEAETGPLEGSWKGISFLNPVFDGAVLPVLHLNGYKISGPTVLGRESDDNIKKHFEGYGYEVMFVEGTEPLKVHQLMAKTMENAVEKIQKIQQSARAAGKCDSRPRWPLIIMRTPKGWTGPAKVDGKRVEDTFRAHQVPLAGVRESPEHLKMLEDWMKSYKIDELFEEDGKLKADLLELAPKGDKRMSAQPYTNGGLNPQPLVIPDISQYAIKVDANKRATELKQSVNQMGQLIRDIYKANPHSFRLFCPDETNSNRLGAVFEVENRSLMEGLIKDDENVNHSGRVMEVLSEHLCNGWHEGYSLTGRYGLLATYEAFAMVFNSMTLQMVKWFEVVSGASGEHNLPWRKPVSSINLLLTSTCWRNDHNGFSHQGPSFIDTMLNKHGSVARCYFPIDANTLLSTAEHCLASHNRINLIVQDKQPQFQYLSLEEAKEHCKRKVSVFKWASNEKEGQKPDVVICSIGDVMTMEALAATAILREKCPDFTVRFVNVVDLMALYIPQTHPHGLTQAEFDEVFTNDVDVVTAYHAYPGSLHQLVHGRSNASRFHVRGYQENGTTTTPFDMVVLNNVSRYHLVMLALAKTKNPPANAAAVKLECEQLLKKHRSYCVQEMQDMEEVRNWTWKY